MQTLYCDRRGPKGTLDRDQSRKCFPAARHRDRIIEGAGTQPDLSFFALHVGNEILWHLRQPGVVRCSLKCGPLGVLLSCQRRAIGRLRPVWSQCARGGARPERIQNLHLRPVQGVLVWSGWPLFAYWKPRAFAGCVELAFLKLWTSPGISAYASPALKVCGGFPSTS